MQEEEVFPIVDASDLPVKKEEEAVVIPVVEKKNGKRKVPEESADKKDTEKEKKVCSFKFFCIYCCFHVYRKALSPRVVYLEHLNFPYCS